MSRPRLTIELRDGKASCNLTALHHFGQDKKLEIFPMPREGEKMKNQQENPFFASMPEISGAAAPGGTLPLSPPLHGDR